MIKNSKRILIIFSSKEKLLHECFFNSIVRSFLLFKCSISLYRDRSIENLFNQSDQSLGEEGLKRIEKIVDKEGLKMWELGLNSMFASVCKCPLERTLHSDYTHSHTFYLFSATLDYFTLSVPPFSCRIYIFLPFSLLFINIYMSFFFLFPSVTHVRLFYSVLNS